MKRNNEKQVSTVSAGSGLHKHLCESRWQRAKTRVATVSAKFFLFFLLICVLVSVVWVNASLFSGICTQKAIFGATKSPKKQEFPLKCLQGNLTKTCPSDYPTKHKPTNPDPLNQTCPSYFRWIHEDLRHWKSTGITRDMLERARKKAYFRLVIVDGKAYVEKYRQSIQTRDLFTLWGIVQLLRWYPGRLPDLELMFNCADQPVLRSKDFRGSKAGPPPLFRYCSEWRSLDIVFPDWTFWGWAETNIRPWRSILEDIKEGNKRTEWKDRIPYAYWKGYQFVSPIRISLLKCNGSKDWNTQLYEQDWIAEIEKGFKNSNLEDQCTHRYKIYIEGWGWSVSSKYILACDAMTLFVRARYHDFFSRGLVPLQHYWPIKAFSQFYQRFRDDRKCTSLKYAVEWGNNHTEKAQAIGKAGSRFIHEELKMDYIYDYMFHLLNEYAKLLKFKPSIPSGAVELCSETLACPAVGTWKKFMVESMVKAPSDSSPCTMPPPFDPSSLQELYKRNDKTIKQVEMWEDEYLQNRNKKQ